MRAASDPRSGRDETRLLVIDETARARRDTSVAELPRFLRDGDLLVLNDAATLPASLRAETEDGEPIELRLLGSAHVTEGEGFAAVALGAGDYHTRTEDRGAPPALRPGAVLQFGTNLRAQVRAVSPISPRLIDLSFELSGAQLWAALYALGRPVQYAHVSRDLELWSVQTRYASRPWAAEMPSAGRPLTFGILLQLQRRGVALASLTHAAGLSATGDPALDAALPLPERYELPEPTVRAVLRARARGGRVVAVGTTVVRALEGAAVSGKGQLRPGVATTDLRIGPGFEPLVVSGLLTGMHSPGESHYELLQAFADERTLRDGFEHARTAGYLSHELGDSSLILRGALAVEQPERPQRAGSHWLTATSNWLP